MVKDPKEFKKLIEFGKNEFTAEELEKIYKKINNNLDSWNEIENFYEHTKMTKLLFYADFYHFKKTGFSITGFRYQAIQKGPVPKNYDWIFDNSMEKKFIKIKLHDYGNYIGEQFLSTGAKIFEEELFTLSELKAVEAVVASFKKATVNEIVNTSHEEKAWNDNVNEFRWV